MSTFTLPGDLPFPACCPRCGEAWVRTPWAYGPLDPLAPTLSAGTVYCAQRHPHRQQLTPEQLGRFLRIMRRPGPTRPSKATLLAPGDLSPPGGGRWGDLSGLDPTWVFDQSEEYLPAATLLALTEPERSLVADASRHLPAGLRPAHAPDDDLHWIDDADDFVLVHRVDEHVTEVFSFKYDVTMVLYAHLDGRTRRGTLALYRDGEKVTLPW